MGFGGLPHTCQGSGKVHICLSLDPVHPVLCFNFIAVQAVTRLELAHKLVLNHVQSEFVRQGLNDQAGRQL